jgi:hypothetical protein
MCALLCSLTLSSLRAQSPTQNPAPTTSFIQLIRDGRSAFDRGDLDRARECLTQASERSPANPVVLHALARVEARAGNGELALRLLRQVSGLSGGFDPASDDAFSGLKGLAEFAGIVARFAQAKIPIRTSRTAFTLKEKDFIPEGIAYHPVERAFFLGSIHKAKVVRVDRHGHAVDFVPARKDGLFSVLGMKADRRSNLLYVCSNAGDEYRASAPDAVGSAALFAFDLDTGALRRKLVVSEPSVRHLFNDLAIAERGDVYLTDSEADTVWYVGRDSERPEVFHRSSDLTYPNGIALSPDGRALYVAHAEGVTRIEITTRVARRVTHPPDLTLAGIDGLSIFGSSLVAVQNEIRMDRVVQLFLNAAGDAVVRSEVLESNNPRFSAPTTGAVAGDEFYYIANSLLDRMGEGGELPPPDRLEDVLVLVTRLRR